jgi:DMSO reductase anchor subunit
MPVLSLPERLLLAGLLVGGAVLSAGHLGRPSRGPLALRGLGRSPLSAEVFVLTVTAGCALLASIPVGTSTLRTILDGLTSVGSVALLLLIGAVYRLPGQLAWGGPVTVQPLVAGSAWGLLWAVGLDEVGPGAGLVAALWVALLADAVLAGYRLIRLEDAPDRGEILHPRAFHRRRPLQMGRLALSSLASPVLLLTGAPVLALLAFSGSILVDRYAFYALAVRQTTESEVARVEALLR